jgi:hypothetical protein
MIIQPGYHIRRRSRYMNEPYSRLDSRSFREPGGGFTGLGGGVRSKSQIRLGSGNFIGGTNPIIGGDDNLFSAPTEGTINQMNYL